MADDMFFENFAQAHINSIVIRNSANEARENDIWYEIFGNTEENSRLSLCQGQRDSSSPDNDILFEIFCDQDDFKEHSSCKRIKGDLQEKGLLQDIFGDSDEFTAYSLSRGPHGSDSKENAFGTPDVKNGFSMYHGPSGNIYYRRISNLAKEQSHDDIQKSADGKTQNNTKPTRNQIALSYDEIEKDLEKECGCADRCQKKFSPEEIIYWRYKVHTLPIGDKRMDKIKELLKMSSLSLTKHERNQQFKVSQHYCCRSFFLQVVLKVSVSTLSRAKRNLNKQNDFAEDDAPKQYTHAVKARICEGFIVDYISTSCDKDPTSKTVWMPAGMTKLELHSLYKSIHNDGLEKSEFYNILQKKFDFLLFSKNQRLTKCTYCYDFRCLIEGQNKPEEKKNLMEIRKAHLLDQKLEREAYYVRRAQAECRKSSILSVILDGMDQSKTDLPHFLGWNNPNGAGALRLRTHITGSIVHGRGKYFFIDKNEIPHDTNLSLSCLMKILKNESKENVLPPTLYVQLDNTVRENKNKYFIGMMAYLVKMDFVAEVFLSFLLVGHTHEDIDQCFSKISQQLKRHEALTMADLIEEITQSQSPKPKTVEMGTVWDIKAWIDNYINQIHNVTYPQIYRSFASTESSQKKYLTGEKPQITKDESDHVNVEFKVRSYDKIWRPTGTEKTIEIFKLNSRGKQLVPTGSPNIVPGMFDEDDVKDLKRSLEKDFQLAKFTTEKVDWWKNFFLNPVITEGQESWPRFQKTSVVSPESTLSEKELERIKSYQQKREAYKQVFTKLQRPKRKKDDHDNAR